MNEEITAEIEVLESIFATGLIISSPTSLSIECSPDPPVSNMPSHLVSLQITYTDSYPSELPSISLEVIEGTLSETESEELLTKINELGEESLGMAMVYTLVLGLQEALSDVLERRKKEEIRLADEKHRLEEEAEAKRTAGTKLTPQNFLEWRNKFEAERLASEKEEEDKRLKLLPLREREELKKYSTRLTGRELFIQNAQIANSALIDAEDKDVDISRYERVGLETEEVEKGLELEFSDDDD